MESVQALLDALPLRIGRIPLLWAQRSPQAPALCEAGRAYGYGELARAVETAASVLRSLGVLAGDRMMIVGENSVAQVTLLMAASLLDAWAVIVNARLSAPEIDALREHCRPRRVFYTCAVSKDAAGHGATLRDLQPIGEIAVGPIDEACAPEPVYADGSEQVAALIYTSGTTGNPKGVMLTHRNLLFIAAVSARLRGLTPSDRAYGVLPVSHVYGLASVLLGTLYAGACLYVEPRFSPERLVRHLAHDGITALQGVPVMYAKLLDWLDTGAAKLDAPQLRFVYAGGAPLDPTLKTRTEAAFGLTLHNGYGMTESSPTIAQTRLDRPRTDCSVGPPIPGVQVRIVDRQGRDLAAGEVGELWVRGPNVMKGYYRNAASTAEAIKPGGWLNTGDLARQGPDGALFIEGRTRELIIRSGFNVYPVEVEMALNAHPDVIHSAVVGRSVESNEEVVAFVELAPGSRASADDLRGFVKDRLSPYKQPSEIVILPALPAAATGKVLKHKLKQMAQKMYFDAKAACDRHR